MNNLDVDSVTFRFRTKHSLAEFFGYHIYQLLKEKYKITGYSTSSNGIKPNDGHYFVTYTFSHTVEFSIAITSGKKHSEVYKKSPDLVIALSKKVLKAGDTFHIDIKHNDHETSISSGEVSRICEIVLDTIKPLAENPPSAVGRMITTQLV